MNIWYFHHYGGGPGLGLYDRPYRLARAWRRLGHEATIFIASFHHLLEKAEQLPPELTLDGVRYVCLPTRRYQGNGPARLLNMWDFCKGIDALRRSADPAPDAVIVSSPHPFGIFAASRLARRRKAKLVFEFRDIWPLSITEIAHVSPWHPFVQLAGVAERFALRNSDLVASVLPRADRYLADRGFGEAPFVWAPNGIDVAEKTGHRITSEEGGRAAAKLEEWRAAGKTTIIYTGSIGAPNAIDLLVEAVAHGRLAGEADACGVLVVGSGEQLEKLKAFSVSQGLTNIHFSGRLPKNDALALLRLADIGYAGLRNIERLFGYGVSPNKIADYFQASLPVFLPISPCGDPVSESGGGLARSAETPQAVWAGLRALMAMPGEERRLLGARGKDYLMREYDYDAIAARYIAAMTG